MKCDSSLTNRIKRARGQMNGVIQMMESDIACVDILTQLKAIRSSIDKTIALLTTKNLIQTIEKDYHLKIDNIDEALGLILKGK
jgi:DNA-binding FrmR family transcriptional regulator